MITKRFFMTASLLLAFLVGPGHVLAAGYANTDLLVETDQLSKLINDPGVRIVDVRSRDAYRKGHIPNAVHLGYNDIVDPKSRIKARLLPAERLAVMLGKRGIGKDTQVILYDDRGGFRASRLFWMLEYFGHQHVSVLNGGFPKWEKEGRKVLTSAPSVNKVDFPIDYTPRRMATADWIVERQNDSNVVVIDVRGPKTFEKGHIPWANNIPWTKNLAKDSTLKSADDLSKHFASKGMTKDKNIVVHCQDGRAAAHSYFTLRVLGIPEFGVTIAPGLSGVQQMISPRRPWPLAARIPAEPGSSTVSLVMTHKTATYTRPPFF